MCFRAYKWHVQAQGREGERVIMADCERAEKETRRDLKDIRSTGFKPSERERAALKALRERIYHGRVLKSMKQYVMFCIKQETIFDTGKDEEVLCASLKQMPNVYRLSIIDRFAKVNQELGVEHRWYEKESKESFGCSLAPMRWPARYQKVFRDASDEHIRPSNRPWDCRGIVSGRCNTQPRDRQAPTWTGKLQCSIGNSSNAFHRSDPN